MQFYSKKIVFLSGNFELVGYYVYPSSNQPPGVLFIHGGGKYAKNLYKEWQEYLCKNGYASLSFYSRGVGESKGNFEDGSLNNRLKDTMAAYDAFIQSGIVDPNRICVSGSSMGAHVALRLVEKLPHFKTLILQSAAAYSKKAENLPLNGLFTEEIRKNSSWQKSPVFTILRNYKGATLVVYGKKDNIIPDGVKKVFRKSILKGKYLTLMDGQHTLLRPKTPLEEEARNELFKQSVLFLNKYL